MSKVLDGEKAQAEQTPLVSHSRSAWAKRLIGAIIGLTGASAVTPQRTEACTTLCTLTCQANFGCQCFFFDVDPIFASNEPCGDAIFNVFDEIGSDGNLYGFVGFNRGFMTAGCMDYNSGSCAVVIC